MIFCGYGSPIRKCYFEFVIPFGAAFWDDPEALLGNQGVRLSVDPES
jgi:hypothetical protein